MLTADVSRAHATRDGPTGRVGAVPRRRVAGAARRVR